MTRPGPPGDDGRVLIEVRTYALVPGSGPTFRELMVTGSAPMLARHGITVLFHGPAEQAPDRYLLVRAFADEADRAASLAAFYGSPEWMAELDGPITDLIVDYHVVAVSCPAAAAAAAAFTAGLAGG